MEARIAEVSAKMCMTLLEGKRRLSIADLVLPWRPLYTLLERELFPKQRKTGMTTISDTLLDLAEYAQRFYDPQEAEEMLREMLPMMDGSSINSILATQSLLVHFLPISHPQAWLPAMFRLWESFSSSLFDDQMLDLLARVAEMHVEDPRVSSVQSMKETGIHSDEYQAEASSSSSIEETSEEGEPMWNEVGIFTEAQFSLIMTKCLRSAGLPVGASKAANATLMAQSASHRTGPDLSASAETLSMNKPTDRLHSFAIIIAYSIAKDSASPSEALTPMNNGASKPTHLAGSKALDALARFIQATESYFHPSNWGMWVFPLSTFVKNMTWEFVKRSVEEGKPECRTPKAWRLTADIKREFCSTLRTVCLLSMFSKDPLTIAASQASLKRMVLLEPSIILPPVLDRAYSSLEALETTHRTSSIITALSTLSLPLISRHIYHEVAKHLVPLLHLCIPGIDLNDSVKTMATSMFILLSCTIIKVDDLTRPELGNGTRLHDAMDTDAEQSKEEEEDEALRLSTAGFEDWTVSFFRRVLALFEALPEEGKGGRTGGKMEEQVTNTLLAACDAVCGSLSDHLFDINFKIVSDFCFSTVSASVVRVIGSLISCFARHNPRKVLAKLLKPCSEAIRAELKGGASSTRTTSTSVPYASDTALHWHLSILIGSVSYPGEAILLYKDELLDLMQVVCDHTKTERGYSFAARLVQRLLLCLVSIYPREQRFVNEDEWKSEEMIKSSHKYWGKVYLAKEVNINWHMPTDAEIAFALEILDKIVAPRLGQIEALQAEGTQRDKIWSNDFCRHLTVARMAYLAVNAMAQEPELGGGVPAVDAGDEVPEFVQVPDRFKSGFLLTDDSDPRYQAVLAFRRRFGAAVQLSARMTQVSEAEDQIDCVKLLVRSIRSYMTSYSFNPEDYKAHSRSLAFYRSMAHLSARQKKYPRIFWIRRAAYYHTSRARLNSFHRRRSALDDDLIARILEFSMSNYVGIRKTAQNALDTIAQHYDGTRLLCLPTLLENVAPGTSDDRMKGALYVLGSKSLSHLAILDSRFSGQYIIALLRAQHHSKPSIQKLVRGIINDFVIRFAEPCTIRDSIESPALQSAADFIETKMELKADASLLEAVASKRKVRVGRVDEMVEQLVPQLLAIADSPDTHWSFSIYAARLLRALVRKDQPLNADVARYLARQASSENPTMRRVAQNGVTKVLYFAKIRTLCLTNEELLLSSAKVHPLKRKQDLPERLTDEWKRGRLEIYSDPALNSKTKLQDKSASGWLVWGTEETFYQVPPESGNVFDWSDKATLQGLAEELNAQQWSKMMMHFSQEKDRDYLSAETTNLIKSIFQVYGIDQLQHIKATVEAYIGERDRHKHRAAAEVIAGLYRGSKHWNMHDQRIMWEWLGGLLPKILSECTPDSQPTWQLAVEYMLQQRDPRRATILIDYVVKTASESLASTQSPWEQAKSQNLLRGVLLALGSKFEAWSPPLIEMYFANFDHDFAEVRNVISESVADLELLQVAPSFSSVSALLESSRQVKTGSLLASNPEQYQKRLDTLAIDLIRYKSERIPKSQGTSKYDLVSMTALLWISTTMGDHRNTLLSSKVIDFIPTIFESFELHDNTELSAIARAVLTKLSVYQFEQKDVKRLVKTLLGVIENSKDSWRSRLDALPVLQVVYFQNLFYLDSELIEDIIESLLKLLQDTHLEVREMASTTLSGLVRCSQRRLIKSLLPRFTTTIQKYNRLPKRDSPKYSSALLDLHASILGATALLAAFPYDVLDWMPDLICIVSRHNDSPVPVSTTVKKMASEFKRTHKDTWQENVQAFNSEQLMEYHEWGGRTDYYA
jgi:proteasome activator subunit 4